MKKRPGFTLLEVLISLSLAAFIMGTITRALVNLVKTTTRARQILELDHKVTIFFNQLDRDFIAALVPNPLHYDSEKEALAKDQASKNKSDVEKTSTDKPATEKSGSGKKKKPPYFAALCDEEETLKIDGKPHRLFKVAHFINTGPLYVHEERKVRLARVGYTLKKLKKKKEGDIDVYELFRKETADLANHTFKEDQDVKPGSIGSKDKKSVPVSTILVLDNIKDFFIEYSAPKPPPEKDNPEQSSKPVKKEKKGEEEKEYIHMFDWKPESEEDQEKAKKSDKKGFAPSKLPEYVNVTLRLWRDVRNNDPKGEFFTYRCMIPILAYQACLKPPAPAQTNSPQAQNPAAPAVASPTPEHQS